MICIGHSHMACVMTAAEEARTPLDAIALEKKAYFRELRHSPTHDDPGRGLGETALARLAEPGAVYAFIGGVNHLTLGLKRHPVPFDFVLPDEPDLALDSGAQIVPYGAMERIMATDAVEHLRELRKVAWAA